MAVISVGAGNAEARLFASSAGCNLLFVAACAGGSYSLNGTVYILGPWASTFEVTAQITLSGSATIGPLDPTDFNSFSGFAVYTDLSAPGGLVERIGGQVGALGDLEVFGNNFGANCTSCTPSANIVWFPGFSNVTTYSITTTSGGFSMGSEVGPIESELDLELPSGFSVASSVPEASTWLMLLIGFAVIGFAINRRKSRAAPVAEAKFCRRSQAIRFLFALLFLFHIGYAQATTYDYTGNQFTTFDGICDASACTNITASVKFSSDTSSFTGTLSLAGAESVTLAMQGSQSGLSYAFPGYTIWYNPPLDTYGFSSGISGWITLTDGAVTAWALSGGAGQVGCGGGPGCANGSSYASSVSSDGFSADIASFNIYPYYGGNPDCMITCGSDALTQAPGLWTEETFASSVPEPSTWAMLLVGFMSIRCMANRKRSNCRHQKHDVA